MWHYGGGGGTLFQGDWILSPADFGEICYPSDSDQL